MDSKQTLLNILQDKDAECYYNEYTGNWTYKVRNDFYMTGVSEFTGEFYIQKVSNKEEDGK